MIVGQSAGVAAAMAVRQDRPVHRIDIEVLRQRLRSLGQILTLEDSR